MNIQNLKACLKMLGLSTDNEVSYMWANQNESAHLIIAQHVIYFNNQAHNYSNLSDLTGIYNLIVEYVNERESLKTNKV